jgi:MYXO-CTERM domain-containing protein
MKKLLLLAALLGTTGSVLAQGTVAFSNLGLANTYKISTNNLGNTGFMQGANSFRIGLYAGAAGTPASGLTLVGLATNQANAALAGQFTGGNPFTVNGLGGAGTTIAFQLRGWSFANGLSYEEAMTAPGALLGVSGLGSTVMGGGTTPPGALWTVTNPNGITGFEVSGVPEPSSIALGLLGLGAIALFRRRK